MNAINRIQSVSKIIYGLRKYQNSSPSSIIEEDSFYPGLNNEDIPLKIFSPKSHHRSTLILYPGATVKGEAHPKMITLARSLAGTGIKVLLPRIPPLIDLQLSKEIFLLTIHFYKWVLKKFENDHPINLAGVSFGGVIVLKACLDSFLIKNKPKSILVFGTSYDVGTSMEFMFSGKIDDNGRALDIKPDPWSIIVLFHNYLNEINIGYETKEVAKGISYFIHQKNKKLEELIKRLHGPEKHLINDIIELNISDEIKRIMDIILKDCSDQLEFFSPKFWCGDITNNIFILHGKNDSLSPYTESIKLDKKLPNSDLLITGLFEHREISNKISFIEKYRETLNIYKFLSRYLKKVFS